MAKLCVILNCNQKHYAKNLCHRHYEQKRIYGRVLTRTRREKNEFIMKRDSCEIVLYDKNNKEKTRAIVDAEDVERCKEYKWTLSGSVRNKQAGSLASFVLGKPKLTSNQDIDHVDGCTLNNRKFNLQIILHKQNSWKQKKHKNNTSGFRGVSRNGQKWCARVSKEFKSYFIGNFSSKNEAASAYDKKAKELFGEFAVLNSLMKGVLYGEQTTLVP